MAKMYYRYGTMNSSKTANLLMTGFNYEQQGKNVIYLKSAVDSRWSSDEIVSRVGIRANCITVASDTDVTELISGILSDYTASRQDVSVILVDEAQFLTRLQVSQLSDIVDTYKIPVICYGLKNSFIDGKLFEGSDALLYYSDSIEEIKTICHFCERKAIMNLRVVNGNPVYESDTAIALGDVKESDDYFVQTCRVHYKKPLL